MKARGMVIASVAWLCASAFVHAETSGFPADVVRGIDAMARLPVRGFSVVESQGRMLLMSDNGHYVIVGGRLLDMWNQTEVHSVSDVRKTERIPVRRMGLTADKFGGLTLGQGPRVMVWLDALGAETRAVLDQIGKLRDRFTFEVVWLPALPQRKDANRALICSKRAAEQYVRTADPEPLRAPAGDCGREELAKTLTTAAVLGIDRVPFSIAPNGQTLIGASRTFAEFLAQNLE